MSLPVRAIGHIRTARTDPDATPVQSTLNPDEPGSVVLDPEYREGTAELDGFDYAWLLTWLGPVPEPGTNEDPGPAVAMRQVPFLLSASPRPIGLFAMRGPRRPNPIGLHLVRVTALTPEGFTFTGVDMVDRTPLLDIKPWVADLDRPAGGRRDDQGGAVRSGWFDTVDLAGPHTPRSLQPPGSEIS